MLWRQTSSGKLKTDLSLENKSVFFVISCFIAGYIQFKVELQKPQLTFLRFFFVSEIVNWCHVQGTELILFML